MNNDDENKSLGSKNTNNDLKQTNMIKKKSKEMDHSSNVDFADSYTDDGHELSSNKYLRKIQKSVVPYRKKIRQFMFFFKDSMRIQRLTIVGVFLTVMIGSLVLAQITSVGYVIKNTPINSSRSFLNGDTTKIKNVVYDPNSQSAMLNITTNSDAGVLNGKDLTAKFVLMKAPKHPVQAPTLDLISTYGNHFTILVKHLYNHFGAIKFILFNKRQSSLDEFSKALNNGSNDQTATPLTDDQVDTVTSYKSGNKQAANNTNLQGDIKTNNGSHFRKAQALMKTMQANNTAKFILTEKKINQYHGSIKADSTPKGIMFDSLNKTIGNLKDDIHTQKQEITSAKKSIKSINKQVSDEYSDRLNDSKNEQIHNLKDNIKNIQNDIKSKQGKISNDKEYISKYQNQLELIKKGTVVMNDTVKSEKADLFQP